MCLLCNARKAKSVGSLLRTAYRTRGSVTNAEVSLADNKGSIYMASCAYSAVPQPADAPTTNRVDGYVLHPSTLNKNILKAQYAVRGELYNKAQELAAKGRDIIYTNGECCRLRSAVVDMCDGLPSGQRKGS